MNHGVVNDHDIVMLEEGMAAKAALPSVEPNKTSSSCSMNDGKWDKPASCTTDGCSLLILADIIVAFREFMARRLKAGYHPVSN